MARFNVHKRAERLRRRGTYWEQIVRVALRRHKVNHLFQYVYAPYIVDFLLFDRNVILEIDGDHHATRQLDRDNARTAVLEGVTPCTVVRWLNTDVTTKLPALVTELRKKYPTVNNTPPDLTYGRPRF